MISLYGVYENGKITLLHKLSKPFPEETEVLLTFYGGKSGRGLESDPDGDVIEKNEDYYKTLREFERVKAEGNITIIDQNKKYSFPLNDYSQGGLSFFSDRGFKVGQAINAGISDPSNSNIILMELAMEVRGIFENENRSRLHKVDNYKVGCMFIDPMDEDLWHGLLQYLG